MMMRRERRRKKKRKRRRTKPLLRAAVLRNQRQLPESRRGVRPAVELEAGEVELYRLASDPHELVNLAGSDRFADTQSRLARRLDRLRQMRGTAA
jgi:hypothetical protein